MAITDYKTIGSLKDGESGLVVCMVLESTKVPYRNKEGEYTKLRVKDSRAEYDVSVFEESVRADVGDIVTATVSIKGNYKNARGIRPCTDPDISLGDFVSRISGDPESLYAKICRMVMESNPEADETSLSHLTLNMYARYKDELLHSSAAKTVHHNAIGGLMMHTESMVRMAMCYADNYPTLDRELLVCGAALHDIGKIREMETGANGNVTGTPAGALLGHLAIGMLMVEDEAKGQNYNPERVMLLQHLIASHHGRVEFGAIKLASIPEAAVLNHIDDADASIEKFAKQYRETNLQPGEVATTKPQYMDNFLYKPTSFSED